MDDHVPVRLAIVGAHGRLGTRITALAAARDDVRVVAALGREDDDPSVGVDVVIDVSGVSGAARAIALADRLGAPLLQAGTGLAEDDVRATERLSGRVAVLVAPNLSRGVALLHRLLAEAAAHLPEGWTVDLVETHHVGKRDAPSGTALALAETLRAAGRALPPDRVHAVRAGGVVGDHEIVLGGPLETVRLRHEAIDRDLFARGALDAARWLHGRAPGRYGMQDVLGS